MKRTKDIAKARFRKRIILAGGMIVVSAFLSGCDVSDDTYRPYSSISECQKTLNDYSSNCTNAYKSAVDNAKVTGKSYRTKEECEKDNDANRCEYTSHGGAHFYPYPHYYSYGGTGSYAQPFYRSRNSETFRSRTGTEFSPTRTANGLSGVKTVTRSGFGSTSRSHSSFSSRSFGG